MTAPVSSLSSAPGWWLLTRPGGDDGLWLRSALAAWGLTADGVTVPLVVARGATEVIVADLSVPPTRLMHDSEFAGLGSCACTLPDLSPLDPAWCRVCGSIVAEEQR